jgi:hypothetical protein
MSSSSVILPFITENFRIMKKLFAGDDDKEVGMQRNAYVPNRSLSVSPDCLLKDVFLLHCIIHFGS